jgi:hypothetical protein
METASSMLVLSRKELLLKVYMPMISVTTVQDHLRIAISSGFGQRFQSFSFVCSMLA